MVKTFYDNFPLKFDFLKVNTFADFFRQNTIFIITSQNIRSFIYLELSPVSTPFYVDNVENF